MQKTGKLPCKKSLKLNPIFIKRRDAALNGGDIPAKHWATAMLKISIFLRLPSCFGLKNPLFRRLLKALLGRYFLCMHILGLFQQSLKATECFYRH